MFKSQVATYLADRRVAPLERRPIFDTKHPLYRAISELSSLRKEHAALRRGRQIVRNYAEDPGLFAVSRIDPNTGREMLVAFNTSAAPLRALVEIDAASTTFKSLHGDCSSSAAAPGSYRVALQPFDYIVCAAQ
jgi:hypothetical protein